MRLSSIVLAFALLAAACGSGDDGGTDRSPSVTATADPLQSALESMVLVEAELPAGMQRVSATFNTNEEAAEGAADPEAEIRKFDTWGRRLGYTASYIAVGDAEGQTVLGVTSEVNAFADAQGASLAYDDLQGRAAAADWANSFPQLDTIEVTYPDAAGFGDEAYWIRVTGFTIEEPRTLFVVDQLIFRAGEVRAFLRSDTQFPPDASRDIHQDQFGQWATLMTDRIGAAELPSPL
jgi:hypothetical protein